ncbi:MAG: DNA primase, partial [Verrucomicrobiales bacterium]|nr:DNA primase [Verrucomicrobiales bacterium]
MGQIPRETIEQILDSTDIVELIGSYLQLTRAGSNHKALCPFHIEKSPSFNVNPHTQRYKCFGCQVSGDAIEFVKEYENLPFNDAVRKLADQAGIQIVEDVFDAKEEARRKSRAKIQRLQIEAAKFFNMLLFKKDFAQPARDYLKARGLGMDVSRSWQFGYAPENQSIFFQWAEAEGFPVPLLVEGGLAAWRDEYNPNRGAYARFRHRLMFPVNNDFGDTIAFSGRVLDKDQKGGKYVNSPETPLFDKSKTFYGFDKTKRPILREKKAIVMEGQLDLIAAYESGIENVTAAMGTAFTAQHAQLLKRHTDEAILCFDSDTAGVAAATKAFRVLAPTGMLVRIALVPPGEDPDSLIRKHGPASLEDILNEAPEFFDFQIDRRGSLLTTGPLRDRLNFAKELAFDIALVDDKMVQDSLINRISVRLKVGEEDIRRQVSNAKRDQIRAEKSKIRRENMV